MDPQHGRTRLAKGFIVAAPASGSGKTLITLGLIRALKNKGLRVLSAKTGPDYIDPQFHAAASGAPCINLDPWAMGPETCRSAVAQLGRKADVVVIEGVMGLFDGPMGARGSTADLAADLGLPVVLVVDASHQAQSAAAILKGFQSFRDDIEVVGVIFNRVKSDRHYEVLSSAINAQSILGAVRHDESIKVPSRHLGLVQAFENQQLEKLIEDTASRVARETELDRLLLLSTEVSNQPSSPSLPPLGTRIAIARDEAFSFFYSHILNDWRAGGVEISFFSPLANEAPQSTANAIFLPGGYPELHAARLAASNHFFDAIRRATVPVYGECGGYMVLGNAIVDASGRLHAMAGLLPVTTSFAKPKLHLGYRQLEPFAGPWTKKLRGHEFHYSTIEKTGNAQPLFRAKDAADSDLGPIGMVKDKVMGSYAHIISEAP
jgi:cobyrinic acid a,c-diamide synthase